jgi:hypothetical protein
MRIVPAVVLAVALATSSAAFGGADARRPTLRITDLAPLTVRGVDFRPGERVKLLVSAGGPVSRAVRAGPRGGFLVRLGVRVDASCCSAVVQAIGTAGSRAMVDLARPGCDERP